MNKDDKNSPKNDLTPSNIKKIPKNQTAVSIKESDDRQKAPLITSAGRGHMAEKIIQLALENDVKIRQDSDLAELLAKIEIDSPIPTEAFFAVAEILSYVYRANGQPDPFNTVIDDDIEKE